jgi:hypothetical protein
MRDRNTTLAGAVLAVIILGALAAFVFGRITLAEASQVIAIGGSACASYGLFKARDREKR